MADIQLAPDSPAHALIANVRNGTRSQIDKLGVSARRKLWIGGALLISVLPFAWLLFYSLLGVAAAGAVSALLAVSGVVAVNAWPVLVTRARNARELALMKAETDQIEAIMMEENRRLERIKAEAEASPIPTLQNQHAKDKADLEEFSASIAEREAEISAIETNIQKLTRDLRPEDVERFTDDIRVLRENHKQLEAEYAEAYAEWEKQGYEIQRASAIWQVSQAINKASTSSGVRSSVISQIKKETALDAVAMSMAKSKAQLRARMRERPSVQQIGHGLAQQQALGHSQPVVIDVPASQINVLLQQGAVQ